jgi:urease accessory protein
MFKNSGLVTSESVNLPTSKQQRLMGAIAILVVISLLTSAGGSPIEHNVSSAWEGFIWGIANPVISLDHLAGILALGLFSARFARGSWFNITFVIAAICGQLINLTPVILPGTAIVIATCTIGLGMMLLTPISINWLAIVILSATAGIFQGYADATSIIGAGIFTVVTYIIGVTLTQTAIIMSAREIALSFGINEINQILPKIARFAGVAFCAIGIVFLGYSII